MPPEPTNDHQRRLEDIVAYLDGELSSAENAAVEQQLARDESFRQEMQGIERAWEALDELPRTTLDDRFSRTTMEMVVTEAAAELDAKTLALPIVRRKRRWSNALAAIAAGLLAFLAVRIVRDAPNRALLADLPVVSNVDRYAQFQSVDFLQQLETRYGAALRAATLSGADLDEEAAELTALARTDDRRGWLDELADEKRTVLKGQYDRFRALPADEQRRMRKLHKQMMADDAQADELFQTLIVYRRWLAQLPASRQFELRRMPADERLDAIGAELRQRGVSEALELTDKQLRELLVALRQAYLKAGGNRGAGDRAFMRGQRLLAMNPAQRTQIVDSIRSALPPETLAALDGMNPMQRFNQVGKWAAQARSLQVEGRISRQELEEYFVEDLDEEVRAELLSLPPEEMEDRLRRLYLGGMPEWDR
ncbi:MAG: hypothetical protein KDA44_18365, partial [Planctomycetales bacterium]|nr:hypothetical protein [Planctomycetales bacterium]